MRLILLTLSATLAAVTSQALAAEKPLDFLTTLAPSSTDLPFFERSPFGVGPAPKLVGPLNARSIRDAIVALARAQDGKPYVWGAEGPDSFDCSGLVWYCYRENGVTINQRTASGQWSICDSLAGTGDLYPGDLVFYGDLSHVGIWTGANSVFAADSPYYGIHEHYWGWDTKYTKFGRIKTSFWPGGDNGYPTCTSPTNLRWTNLNGLAAGQWYRTNGDTRLHYAVDGGTDPVHCQEFAGSHNATYQTRSGYIELAWGGLGMKDFRVESWSGCNNQRIGLNTFTVGWDNQLPTASRSGGAAPNTWYTGSQTVSWSAYDAVSQVRRQWYRWAGGSWAESGGPATLQPGKNTLEVQVEDHAGNVAVMNLGQYWLDNTAPTVSAPVPDSSLCTNAETIKLNLSATDSGAGVAKIYAVVNGTQVGSISAANGFVNWNTKGLPDGEYPIKAVAYDNASPGGNSAESAAIVIKLDKTKPTITPDLPQIGCPGGWYSAPIAVGFTADDGAGCGVASTSAKLDGNPVYLPFEVTVEGTHTAELTAVDAAGNVATESLQLNIDMTQPDVSDIIPAASLDTASAAWTQTDSLSGIHDSIWWLGTTSGGHEIVPPTLTDGLGHFWVTNLNLDPAVPLFLSVKTSDRACNESDVETIQLPPLSLGSSKPFVMASGGHTYEPRVSDNFRVVDTFGEPIAGDFTVPGLTGAMAGMWLPDGVFVSEVPLGMAMALADGSVFKSLGGLVVTGGTDDFIGHFYVEEQDRSRAARVDLNPLAPVEALRGQKVLVTGQVTTDHGEKVVRYPSVTAAGTGTVQPLIMPNQSLAGPHGLPPWGLLVATSGWAIPVSDDAIFILDEQGKYGFGGAQGVWVMLDTLKSPFEFPNAGYVVATGIGSQVEVDGEWMRCIRPRDVSDIQVVF